MKPLEFRQLMIENEKKRIGDIYDECQKRGCDSSFCEAFDTRMSLFPLRQTEIFIEFAKEPESHFDIINNVKKWKIYLEVYIQLRPNDEKTDERKKALELIDGYVKKTNRANYN